MAAPLLFYRVVQLKLLILVTLAYCILVVRPRPPGLWRLMASVPAFVVFGLSPVIVQESVVLSGGLGLTLMWVANFKLLAYSGGRGALAHPAVRSGLQWGILLVLPFFPAKRGHEPATTVRRSALLGVLLKLGVWLGLNLLLLSPDALTPSARHVSYAVYMWMFVSLCLDAAMPLSGHLLDGVPLQPAMDAPYAASSVREFWGRRYNQIVSATLLETVYKPIVEGRWVTAAAVTAAHGGNEGSNSGVSGQGVVEKPGSDLAPAGPAGGAGAEDLRVRAGPVPTSPSADQQEGLEPQERVQQEQCHPPIAKDGAAAAAGSGGSKGGGGGKEERGRTPIGLAMAALGASFLVSGVMHEVCIANMCGGRLEGSFRMLGFFLVQPLLILVQELLTQALLPARLRGSRAVVLSQTVVTLALVLSSAELFWASLESCRIDQRGLEEVVGTMESVAQKMREFGWLPVPAAVA